MKGDSWHPIGVHDGREHPPVAWRFYAVSPKGVRPKLRAEVIEWQIKHGIAAVGFMDTPMSAAPDGYELFKEDRIQGEEPRGIKNAYAFAKQISRGDIILLAEGASVIWAWGICLDDGAVYFDDEHPVWESGGLADLRDRVWDCGTYEQYRNARRVDYWRRLPRKVLPNCPKMPGSPQGTVNSFHLADVLEWLGVTEQDYHAAVAALSEELPAGEVWIPEPLAVFRPISDRPSAEGPDSRLARDGDLTRQNAVVSVRVEAEGDIKPAESIQGRSSDAVTNRAVELRAMVVAAQQYRSHGFEVEDTSQSNPYDLVVRKQAEIRRVEVKGSTARSVSQVFLTKNEVEHARSFLYPVDLVVVEGIEVHVQLDGKVIATGGEIRMYLDWKPHDDDLIPIQYSYRLPD